VIGRLGAWAGSGFYDADRSVRFLGVLVAGGGRRYRPLGRRSDAWDSDVVDLVPDGEPKLVSRFFRSA